MANGPSHPNEQLLKRRSRNTAVGNGTRNSAAMIGPHEQAKQPPVTRGSGPIGPHEQASFTLSADLDNPFPNSAAPRSRARNGSESRPEMASKRLRFNVSLQAKLAKDTD